MRPHERHTRTPAPAQGWAERPIFGKIRYMNYNGCKRKFNIAAYVKYVNDAVAKVRAAQRQTGAGSAAGGSAAAVGSSPAPQLAPVFAKAAAGKRAAASEAAPAGKARKAAAKKPAGEVKRSLELADDL